MSKKFHINLKIFSNTIYEKNSLLIRPLKAKDVKKDYIKSIQDYTINKFLFFKRKKISRKSIENYVLENDNSSNNILFGIFFKKRHIGNTRLTVKKNDAILGIAIFDRRSQGQGFGSKALKIISDFAIKKLNIRTVKGGIDTKNFASIKTFKKAGFLIKPNINIYNKSSRKYCLAIMKK